MAEYKTTQVTTKKVNFTRKELDEIIKRSLGPEWADATSEFKYIYRTDPYDSTPEQIFNGLEFTLVETK
jgi:hypothetical protein